MDLSQMMAEDSLRRGKLPTEEELTTISGLARRQLEIETKNREEVVDGLMVLDPSLPELEEALKRKKAELAQIREFDLPNAIEATGVSEIKLVDGTKLTVKEEVYAGITDENRELAFKWLEATNNDGIIKNDVSIPFGKGQEPEAKLFMDLVSSRGYSFTNRRTVHPQTLKAFIKKQMEDGVVVPADVFSIHIKKVATIKTK